MITHWVVPVGGVDARRVKDTYVHAVVTSWLGHDPQVPWTSATMVNVDGVDAIHVVSLSDRADHVLSSLSVAARPVRLGSQGGQFLTEPIPLETYSYETLVEGPVEAAHCVNFVTPTSVRDGDISSPFLEPSRLAKSAVKRWNMLVDNPTLLLDHAHAAGIWVSDLDGRNVIEKRHGVTVSGFVGRMRFVCPTEDSARLFSTIWAFAEHAGIGSYTASGLGRVLREPTWQPATTPPVRPVRSTAPAPVR